MTFQDLHELLRMETLRRVELGMLTRTGLAREAGFQQAHISNFLNRKRSLSLEGLDRVLAAQNLSLDELMPLDLSAASSAGTDEEDELEAVPVVSPAAVMNDRVVRAEQVIDSVWVTAARLREVRSRLPERSVRMGENVADWQRFVAVRADAEQAAAMEPVIAPGAVALVDRHYRSLAPYRAQQRTLYAVRSGAGLALRYVDLDGGNLILRPLALDFPVQVLPLARGESPADYLVGRVCLVVAEL
ncbi:MAG TPA: helix-turn-helix transcriptional regulator [Acidobacteriaceae bacterium]